MHSEAVGCKPYPRLLACISLAPRPSPTFLSLAMRLSGRGPGTFPHVSDVTDRANYANVGIIPRPVQKIREKGLVSACIKSSCEIINIVSNDGLCRGDEL